MRYTLLLLCTLLFVLPVYASPRYIFLFIGDGLGQEEINFYTAWTRNSAFSTFSVHTLLGNRTSDGRIPDSAASATAIACGIKVREGVLAQDASGQPLKTIAQRAKEVGFRVGIITNVALNDATPAAFYAHASSRRNFDEIAWQLVQSGFDLFVGSGLAASTKEKQGDILRYARSRGYRVVRNPHEFLALKARLPVLALLPFTFAIDRKDHLTLAHCVRKAIELLDNPLGFFLVIEGGRIDWCNHMNDTVSSLRELEDLDAAIREALSFGAKHPEETLVLVTADHETGGFQWSGELYSAVFAQKGSYERFFAELEATPFKEEALQTFLSSFWEGGNAPDTEKALGDFLTRKDRKRFWMLLARSLAEKVGISWTTVGHTATSVPLYAWGEKAALFASATENTDIARILAEEVVTEKVF